MRCLPYLHLEWIFLFFSWWSSSVVGTLLIKGFGCDSSTITGSDLWNPYFLQDLNFSFAIDLCITNVLTYKNILPRPGLALLIVSMWEQTTHQFISSKFIHTPRTYVSQVSLRSWALGIENNNIWAVKTLHHSVTTLLVLANLTAPRQFLVKNFLLKSTITEKDPSDPC